MDEILQIIVFPIIVALTIIGAQAIGVFLRNWLNSPRLRFRTDDFYIYKTALSGGGDETWYYHLILENLGNTIAKNVIVKIEVFSEEGQVIDRLSQLSVEFRGYVAVDIASKSYEVFDFCEVPTWGEPDLYFTSLAGQESNRHLKARSLGPGTYITHVFIFADNFRKKECYQFKIIRREGNSEKDLQIEFLKTLKRK